MNILEAATSLQEGKEIRLPHWPPELTIFLSLDGSNILRSDTNSVYQYFTPELFLDEGWEISEGVGKEDVEAAWELFVKENQMTFPTPEDEQNAHSFFVAGWESGEKVSE